MIPVEPQTEPSTFEESVRKKAVAFLTQTPAPSAAQIRKRAFWRNALEALHTSYGEICSYSGLWCSLDAATVDHFIPINDLVGNHPGGAYEWANFRLASRSMNTEKGVYRDVMDPFTIEYDWFVIDFTSLFIKPGPNLPVDVYNQVSNTIKRLKLNDKERYIKYRLGFLLEYREIYKDCGKTAPALKYLQRKAPFIAYELERQELTEDIINKIRYPKKR